MIDRFWQTVLVIIFLDQASKVVVSSYFPHLVQLNTGISFGLAGNLSDFILVLITSLMLVGVYAWQFTGIFKPIQVKTDLEQIAWGLVFGGGISNLIDRFLWGGVKDWLLLPVFNVQNNLADYAINLGLISLVGLYYWHENKHQVRDSA